MAEIVGAVTAVAVATKTTVVYVIPQMTGHAFHRCFICRTLEVAAVAGEAVVGTC